MPATDLTPPEPHETARLLLRRPALEDAGPIFRAYASDPAVVRFLSWRPHLDEGETRAFLRSRLDAWAAGRSYAHVLAARDEPAVPIGKIELGPTAHGVSFGYVLGRQHWGRGPMPEALAALAGWSLAQPRVWRAYAFCDAENRASARTMEKAGMAFEGVLLRWLVQPNVAPAPRDCLIYARVR